MECGTERGTAFFVEAHRLLTAFHVVGSALNGNLIYVKIEENVYECELIIVKPGKDIAILRLKDETVSHKYGSLLSMPIEAKTHNECPHVPKLAKFKPPRCPIGVYWNTLCLMRDVWTIKTYMI